MGDEGLLTEGIEVRWKLVGHERETDRWFIEGLGKT